MKRSIKLKNGMYINFTFGDDEVSSQLIESFNKSVIDFPKDISKINEKSFWGESIEKAIGNRNATYNINNVYTNLLTHIEKELLKSRNYPTNLKDLIKYACEEIIKGRIDDWNDTNNLRIRTAEVFSALIQKQIQAAYTEYISKYLGGDTEAKLYINPTKVLSIIINSQSVQQLETINPLEEISMLTRISPIGVGGVKKTEAWPQNAMNIHDSMYSTIDPLETPNSELIGILQHLTIGSAITNTRGLFAERDRANIKPIEILSVGPSLIPFLEHNEGARITMATGQAKQAIPLLNPEVPAVQSGFESIYPRLLSDFFIKKAPIDGTVFEITDLQIVIKGENSLVKVVDISPVTLKSGQGKNGLGVFRPTVKLNQKVKKGDVIAEGANIKQGLIANGINLLAAYMPWKGFNFEDGMVVSESVAKRFTSMHIETVQQYLTEDDDVSFIANIGDTLNKGQIMMTYSPTIYDVETLNHIRSDGGKIVNIEIYSNIPEENIPETLLPLYEDFKNRYINMYGKYPVGTFKEKGQPIVGILIRFTIQQTLQLTKGDKLNMRFFNKGVVSIIESDENMPILPNGDRVDIIYSTLSVINRMNPGQLYELHTGMIAKELSRIALRANRAQFTDIYSKVLTLLDNTDNRSYSKNSIMKLKALNDNMYKQLLEQIKENGFVPIIIPPFKSPKADNILNALKLLGLKTKYRLKLPEFGVITDPVSCGYVFVSKLEHISEKKIHSRSTAGYKSVVLTPTEGKKNEGGALLGELDLFSLLSWDADVVIDEFFGPLSSDHSVKNELISNIINNGQTEFIPTRNQPVKTLFNRMLTSIHLEDI